MATPIPAQPTPTPVSGDRPRYGGVLNLFSREAISHLDVHLDVSPALSTWGPGIAYSRLLRFKVGPDVTLPSLAVECELCEDWSMESETSFVFRLRQGVRWQAISPVDGRPLVAEDIIFSYERQRQGPNAPLLQAVEGLESPQPTTLRVSLAFPDADFMAALADGHAKVVAREAIAVNGDLRNGPTIGTGPWVLTGAPPGGPYTFERNPDYFERGLPFVESLRINVIPDAPTRTAAFTGGLLDVHQMEPQEFQAFRQRQPESPFLVTKDAGTGLEVAMKASAPPFQDVRVRQAVFQAIDPWKAIQDVWLGAAFVSLGFTPVEASWLLPEAELMGLFGHPEQALSLLSQTGLKRPIPVSIKLGDFGEAYEAHAERIADEMKDVGFEPALEVVNRRAFGDEVWLGGQYQMFVGPIAPLGAPNGYLVSVLHSQGRWNTTGHGDEELDRLIEVQAQEFDPLRRREYVQQIQRRAFANAYRFLPATQVSTWTWRPRVQGFHPNFAGFEYFHWSRVWVRN